MANEGHFGSYLLDEADRPLLLSIVRTLAEGLSIPVFCKVTHRMCVDMCVGMCTDMCMDMSIYVCSDMCMGHGLETYA